MNRPPLPPKPAYNTLALELSGCPRVHRLVFFSVQRRKSAQTFNTAILSQREVNESQVSDCLFASQWDRFQWMM